MIFTGLTITEERSEAVDFSYPFFVDPSNVVFRIWDHKESYFYKPLRLKVCSSRVGHNYVCTIYYMDACFSKYISQVFTTKYCLFLCPFGKTRNIVEKGWKDFVSVISQPQQHFTSMLQSITQLTQSYLNKWIFFAT